MRIPEIENAVVVATGGAYGAQSLVLTADGQVWAWGGSGHHGNISIYPPTIIPINGNVVDIAAEHHWSWALTDSRELWRWVTLEGRRGFFLSADEDMFLPDFIALYGEPEMEVERNAFHTFMWAAVATQVDAAVIPQ